MRKIISFILFTLLTPALAFAGEADLKIPELSSSQNDLLMIGFIVCVLGLLFGTYQFFKVKKLKAHQSMLDVSQIIFETCKTYLIQQGKFLTILFAFIAACIAFYFGYLQDNSFGGSAADFGMDGYRYTRLLRSCMVWNQDEYSCKQPDGFCFT